MLGNQYFGPLRNAAAFALMTLFLSGCLMQDEVEVASADAALDSAFELSGSVGDGPVVGAAMRVLRNDGVILDEFESDSTAGYNILVRTKGKYYPLTVDARSGIDIVTNSSPDFALVGAALEPSRKYVVNVNPFSTLAMEIAQDLPGGRTKSNIYLAQDIAVSAMNSGLVSLVARGPMTTTIDSTNVAEIVKSSETLGEIIRRTRDWLAFAGFSSNGDKTISSLGSDLIDSVIDGDGGPRSDARTAAIATIVSTQTLLEAASNELHVNDVDATMSLYSAIQIMNVGAASPALNELSVTGQMLDQINVGLAAADAVSDDSRVSGLRQTVSGIQSGLSPELVHRILPQDYRQILDDVLVLVAVGDENTITTVNDVVRSGGVVPDSNSAPMISGTPGNSVDAGSMYQFIPSASDADGDSLTFAISNMPAWATFNSTTGFLSGIPAESDVGSYSGIFIAVTDGQVITSLPTFTISVASSFNNTPPVITGNPATSVLEGDFYSFVPAASDFDQDPLTFAISDSPPWILFSTTTGEISGTPTSSDVGVHGGIVLSVSDGSATTSLPAFSIAVEGLVVNSRPTISGSPQSVVTANTTYTFTPSASDANNDPLTFSISGLPVWATFNSSSGRISGTPGDAHVGNYTGIIITVSDGTDSADLGPFSIAVEGLAANSRPTISGSPQSVVTANTTYTFTPGASDANNDPLTFSVNGLPVWATFNSSSGRISGTPGDLHVGNYTGIIITVSDGTDSADLGPFSIEVEAVSLGSVTINWSPPTQNEDGTSLSDLAGYRIYWGTTPGTYPNSVTINNPGLTTYVIDNLAPGNYEFVSTSLNAAGVESQYSNSAAKTVP